MFASTNLTTPSIYNINKSVEAPQGPSDGIASLAWFPLTQNNQTLLAAASWDKTVRVWDVRFEPVTSSIQIQPKALFNHESPVLACTFSKQNALFSGSCDSTVRMHNLATNQSQTIGKHDAPVSAVAFDDDKNICISSSWDKTIRFWDCRQSNPAHTINIGAKIYAMSYKSPVLLVAGSDRFVHAVNMQSPQGAPVKIETLMKMQLRCLTVMHDRKGFVAGSIEGRCGVHYFDKDLRTNNFGFKCHRIEERGMGGKCFVYPIHSVDLHPVVPTALATVGGDGTVIFWEIGKKTRLRAFDCVKSPITQGLYSSSGQMFAYSTSYDWCKGFSEAGKSPNKILVHPVKEDMLKPTAGK